MNKTFEYLFFNVYNWYYKMALLRRRIEPAYLTVSIIAFSVAMWAFAIYLFCDRVFFHHYLTSKILAPLMIIVWALFYYLLSSAFLDNYKYLDIYNKYKEYAASNKKARRD